MQTLTAAWDWVAAHPRASLAALAFGLLVLEALTGLPLYELLEKALDQTPGL